MSQTPGNPDEPVDLETQFSKEEQPLSIDAPNDFYGYQVDDADDGFPLLAIVLGGLAIFLALTVIVYLAYTKGVQDGQRNLPPLVMADREPVKVMPEKKPTDDLAQRDLSIYRSMEAQKPAASEPAVSTPAPDAELGDGSLESLYAEERSANDDISADMPSVMVDDGADGLAELDAFLGDASLSEPPAAEKDPLPPIPAEVNVARNPTPVAAPDPEPAAPAVITSADSNHIVQISASRSVAQASANYANLRKKFPDMLKNREPLVQRADLGEKGIFFRLGIGGFASRADATSFCTSLKDKGQDCLVRKVD